MPRHTSSRSASNPQKINRQARRTGSPQPSDQPSAVGRVLIPFFVPGAASGDQLNAELTPFHQDRSNLGGEQQIQVRHFKDGYFTAPTALPVSSPSPSQHRHSSRQSSSPSETPRTSQKSSKANSRNDSPSTPRDAGSSSLSSSPPGSQTGKRVYCSPAYKNSPSATSVPLPTFLTASGCVPSFPSVSMPVQMC